MPELAIIVPARLASQRFPRKLLHPIRGKALILWTAERVRQIAPEVPLYFAVGDEELKSCLEAEGFAAVETDPDLPSGTDRLAAANRQIGAERVINVQADEPLVAAAHVNQLRELILQSGADMATLATRFADAAEFADRNRVKVVFNEQGRALYFSRSPIPYRRDMDGVVDAEWLSKNPCFLHLGLYAYTGTFLDRFTQMAPGKLEQIEKLEQLRALENGCSIAVGLTDQRTTGIDVAGDVTAFENALDGHNA